jgi:hypothetical protein
VQRLKQNVGSGASKSTSREKDWGRLLRALLLENQQPVKEALMIKAKQAPKHRYL